ncbi:hypothetical protein MNBD_BACTEROID07-529 [hydrothermal vent metagenome]|uniref:Death on curing protein, Doc toxin n=1 Tax=hydrothermal vent metagenome TaxID=652676 RepID=A0A3B0VBF4_9ZZZZ
MELEVYWTQFAQEKLEDINDYYEIKASSPVAKKLITGIIEQTINLGKNPRIGQKEKLLLNRPEEFRYLVFKNGSILKTV